jgi:ADP-heptose:LPS heptosyltransferase
MINSKGKYAVVFAACSREHARAALETASGAEPRARTVLVETAVGNEPADWADETVGPDSLAGTPRPDILLLVITNQPEWLRPLRLLGTLIRCLLMRPRRFNIVLFGWSGPKSFSAALGDIAGKFLCTAFRPFYLAAMKLLYLATSPIHNSGKSGKVLALSLDLIGDMVWAAPAISSIKSAAGVEELHLLASRRTAGLAECIPGVDRVITYEAPWLKKIHYPDGGGPGLTARLRNLAIRIRLYTEGYAIAVDFRGESGHAPLMYLTGAPVRVGSADRQATCIRPDDLRYLLTHEVGPEDGLHTLDRNLSIVRALGAEAATPEGAWLEPGEKAGRRMKTLVGEGVGRIVLMQPGASRREKRWGIDGFADAGNRLIRERGVRVVIAGGPDETGLCEELSGRIPGSVNLCGRTTLREFAALVGICDMVICNDTSAISISSAMSTPVVCMVAVNTDLLGPYGVPHRVLQDKPDCYDPMPEHCMCPYTYRCLQEITPDEVYGAACELLDGV